MFQKRKYIYDSEKKEFAPVQYPIAEPMTFYLASEGHKIPESLTMAKSNWGSNSLEIPLPTFTELFKEHAVAPFFVFQVFCVGLWLLDEYWYYSLFTLLMLVLFEATVVFQASLPLPIHCLPSFILSPPNNNNNNNDNNSASEI